ncbi:unnamed protein product [Prunus armeniaca]|uniref:Dynamin stalk domain-containing protein n=1 Tax=Prunus armeniaca TaxID=36596 RepID=A0A6J5Y7U9_PRUAR|nr:unnamed protein product [Prunus armeniaca]CAB4319588.1 unnamed protein product [Prunus armeniaca]
MQYCEAFAAMVDGKSQEMSTKELSGGAKIHYILQSIFVKCLEVSFEFLVRRQITRLLDPSLQCHRFVYDELMKISHACEVTELQRFPILRKHLDEVMVKFLHDGAEAAERMIGNLIEMEVFPFAFSIVSGEIMDNWRWQQKISNLLSGFFGFFV